MKKHLLLFCLAVLLTGLAFSQPAVVSSIVPKYTQGINGTNNKRMPFVFWGHISGLNPLSTYHYYTALDSFGVPSSSNGAGNPYFINALTGTVRRSNNASLTVVSGYDSLLTDANGQYEGWFMVESSGNIRFVPGKLVYPIIVTNNGLGGTSTANRIRFTNDSVWVNDFGTTSGAANQCSAIYDSTSEASKSFVFLYDNVAGTGRPISGAIVEDDGLSLQAVNQISATYKNNADSMPQRWCTIMPNANANGIKLLEYRAFSGGAVLSTMNDSDGVWCSGVNTINPSFGQPGVFLNSFYAPMGAVSVVDSVGVNMSANFDAVNTNGLTFTWDYGDGSPTANGQNTTHTYTSTGWYYYSLVISGSGCSVTVNDSIYVDLLMGVKKNTGEGFKLYPMPVQNNFVIESGTKNSFSVVLFDVTGRILEKRNHLNGKITFELEKYNAGNYFVKISDEKTGEITTKKIIKE